MIGLNKWIIRIIGLAGAGVMVFFFRPEITEVNLTHVSYAFSWLSAGLATSIIISGFTYAVIIKRGVDNADGWQPKFGAIIAVVLFMFILIFFIFSLVTPPNSSNVVQKFHATARYLVILAFLVLIVDFLILFNDSSEEKGQAIVMDLTVAVAALITYFFGKHYAGIFGLDNGLALGFKSGALAFEVIIANLIFEPELILKQFASKNK